MTGQETEQAVVIAVSALVAVSIDTNLQPGENAQIGVPVQFTAVATGAGNILQYRWNFGDGSEQTTTIPTVPASSPRRNGSECRAAR